MQAGSQKKRVRPRYSANGRFRCSQLALHGSDRKSQASEGKIKNISDGGFCLIATHPPETSGFLQDQPSFPRMPAQIPTLVQVRWVEKAPSGRNYHIGLQYMI